MLTRTPAPDPVLQDAVWHPDLDTRALFFNGKSYICANPQIDFAPHRWALFGDIDGSLLSSLTGLRLTLLPKPRLSSIKFLYRHKTLSHGIKRRAAQRISLDLSPISSPFPRDCPRRSYTFDIDGAGGERISKVEYRMGRHRPGCPEKVPLLYKVSRSLQITYAMN